MLRTVMRQSFRHRHAFSLGFSTDSSAHQNPPQEEDTFKTQKPIDETRRGETQKREYQDEQSRVLQAALRHVVKLGWSESAMFSGARDAGVSPSIVGSFPRKEAALVEYFMDDCLQRLLDRIESGEDLGNLVLNERIAKLVRIRLEMQAPYISKWPQALSIQFRDFDKRWPSNLTLENLRLFGMCPRKAQPMNIPTSFKQRALLVDEIWDATDDQAADIDWYVKRTVLGGIYSTSEVYMVTDHSPEFRDTWKFLDHRIKDAFDLQKTVQEAAYLAEAVGAGMGNSLQGFVKRVFQG